MFTECVEVCPHCDCENVFKNYDAVANNYKATCWNCGAIIMLCDECLHADDNKSMRCDWHGRYAGNKIVYGKCFRGVTENKY